MELPLEPWDRRRVRAVLFLYLFMVRAAADCPKPQGSQNIVLTDDALLMNDFPDGVVVMLECAHGYETESGSGEVTCDSGTWTEPSLVCKKKDCGIPAPEANMRFNASQGTLFGAVIRLECDRGYQISGSSYKQCYATGWSGRAKCKLVTCDQPAEVPNGRSLWDSHHKPKYGEIIQYVCADGYTLVGTDSIMCSETGEYDSQPPECKGATTDARITSTMVTAVPPAQEASTSPDTSATATAHRDKTVTSSPTVTVPASIKGGSGSLTTAEKATTTTGTSTTSFPDEIDGAVDTKKDIGYVPVIVSVICVTLVACIIITILHKLLLRKKGSSANGTSPIY